MDYEQKYKDALDAARHIYDAMKSGGNFGGMEDLEVIFPELRESEDERIRKALIELVGLVPDYMFGEIKPNKFIAYLEKQKEQKPNYCHHEVDETGWTEEYRKAYYDGWNNCNMQHSQLKAEQKPADPSDEELQRHQDELYDFKVFAARQAREHHISFVHDFEWNNFCAELLSYFNEKQKPAEWSEEDNEHIDAICRALIDNMSNIGFYTTEALCSWLKSLPHRFSLSSWGEEIRDGFFGKFNHNSWKPSEEQMEALRRAVNKLAKSDVADSVRLSIMYDNLKKLM